MFDPSKVGLKKEKAAAIKRVEGWVKGALPPSVAANPALRVAVKEVICGDPTCAPIDTIIEFLIDSVSMGGVGIPAEVQECGQEEVLESLPTAEVLTDWSNGKDSPWPPEALPPADVDLRFGPDDRVECFVGKPDGWLGGRIAQMWYREPSFPAGFIAPYQVELDDGRLIFAPEDSERCIRAEIGKGVPALGVVGTAAGGGGVTRR